MMSRVISMLMGARRRFLRAVPPLLAAVFGVFPVAAAELEAATPDVIVQRTAAAQAGPTLFLIGDSTMSESRSAPPTPNAAGASSCRRIFRKAPAWKTTPPFNYIAAVRELPLKLDVPLLDLNRFSADLVQRMGSERSKQVFKWTEPGDFPEQKEAFEDDTHLNAFGASRISDLAVFELKAKVPDLAKWLK